MALRDRSYGIPTRDSNKGSIALRDNHQPSTIMNRRYILFALAAMLLSQAWPLTRATAQIPNPGFETWSNGQPAGWNGTNTQQTSDAHSGSSAVMGQVGLVLSVYAASISTSDPSSTNPTYFPYSGRPASFTGYYQFAPAARSNDSLVFVTVFSKANAIVGTAMFMTTQSANSYTQFTAPTTWITGDMPDSAMCSIMILNASASGGLGTEGSTFKLDDVSFSGTSAVATSDVRSVSLSESFPNPVPAVSKIKYSLAADGPATIAVFDVTGRQVSVLASGYQTAGTHMVVFDASALPAGMYCYRLATPVQTISKMLQVVR